MDACEQPLRRIALGKLGQRLSPLRLCRPAADEQMRRSLEQHGQLTALVAFDGGDAPQLVDGFKRLRAAQRLGWMSLRVHVLAVDAATATAPRSHAKRSPSWARCSPRWGGPSHVL